MPKTFARTPSVFSFQRCMLVTDGEFHNLIDGQLSPVPVLRHGLRGTQNVGEVGETASKAAREVANIQQTESAKLDARATALVVTFGLRMLDLRSALSACAADTTEVSRAVRDSVSDFVERALSSEGAQEVCRRIARNVANGAWLWRNRTCAAQVSVTVSDTGRPDITFDALRLRLRDFSNYSADEQALAGRLLDGLRGDPTANLSVRAEVSFGVEGAVEVFPSQGYVEDKPVGFARPLYKLHPTTAPRADPTAASNVVGYAALRDQKIANRLRTIDTWYPSSTGVRHPIPVEPNGASLDDMCFHRADKASSAFGLLARLADVHPDSDDGMYCIASMIRGGVYSGGKTEKKGAKTTEAEAAATDAE
jgi:CRISPR-associated protein Csy3